MMNDQLFDRTRLSLEGLRYRKHHLDLSCISILRKMGSVCRELTTVSEKIFRARQSGNSVILMMGAHVLRSGVQKYIIDLMQKGFISCIAMNGACIVHDYEFALIGSTTESVAENIRDGRFGFWEETSKINDVVREASVKEKGLGEAIGAAIEGGGFPYRDISILAAGYRLNIPVTVHVSIGCDILHQHANCDGGAYGVTSYIDFLKLAKVMENLEDGVVMNFGSAVTAPEVYLKALSMVRNAGRRSGKRLHRFTTLVCDLHDLPDDYRKEPIRESAAYFFRPWKTMLVRTVADGGESFYVKGKHGDTLPQLWTSLSMMCENEHG